MKTSNDLLKGEIQDLKEEIVLVSPKDTPLVSMLYSKGKVVKATDITVTWRERELVGTKSAIKKEGAESGTAIQSTRKMFDNYCQIMERVTSVSGTLGALRPNGVGDEYAKELEDRLAELKRDMEYYFINGTKAVESANAGRQMNGLINMVANVINKQDNPLTLADLEDGMQKMWEKGCNGDVYLFANASEKRSINAFAKANGITINTEVLDSKIGIKVDTIETDFGTIHVVLNRHMANGQILAVDLDLVEVAELRPTFHEVLGKTGDYTKGHVICENTIKLLNQYAGFKVIGIGKGDTPTPPPVEPEGENE